MADEEDVEIVEDPSAEPSGIGGLLQALMGIGNRVLENMSEDQRARIEAEVLAAFGLDDKDERRPSRGHPMP